MQIKVVTFAALAEQLGFRELALELPEGASVGTALDALAARYPDLAAMRNRIATAVNMSYEPAVAILSPGDELALIPPVSGG